MDNSVNTWPQFSIDHAGSFQLRGEVEPLTLGFPISP